MHFEGSVIVDRPLEEVFAYLTKIENLAVWQAAVVEARQTSPDPVGVGSTGLVKAKFLGRQLEMSTEISAWNPPESMSGRSTGGPFPLTIHYALEREDGKTRVTVVDEAEPGGFFRLAAPILEQIIGRQFQSDLETLKAVLESPAQPM
jgi:carbon monoxide dehydrogenase subunit G